MKEIRTIVQAYHLVNHATTGAALATVVRVDGSSYRRSGARMLVLDNGTYTGGISGGCLEGDALRKCRHAIATQKPLLVTYDTTQEDGHQVGVGLGCNGIIDILITPLDPGDSHNPVNILGTITETRLRRILLTVTAGAFAGKAILYEPGAYLAMPLEPYAAVLQQQADEAFLTGKSKSYRFPDSEDTYFVEVIDPAFRLFLVGSGTDLVPVLRFANELGWDCFIKGNALKVSAVAKGIAYRMLPSDDEFSLIDQHSAVVLMSHDLKTDEANIALVADSPARYIGLLGPAVRGRKLMSGVNLKDVTQRFFSPAGLDIGATTPEEIALSIIAEIKTCFAQRRGTSLYLKDGSIHER